MPFELISLSSFFPQSVSQAYLDILGELPLEGVVLPAQLLVLLEQHVAELRRQRQVLVLLLELRVQSVRARPPITTLSAR